MTPHSNDWYDRLSETQESYYYPWQSELAPNHGEDNYLALLRREINATHTVLDIGCGSGELTNEIGRFCKRIIGFDRVQKFIETANRQSRDNAIFLCHNSNKDGTIRLPVEERCIDYFVSSKGPLHWISDAARVANKPAKIIMLVPYLEGEITWNEFLPTELKYWGWNKDSLIEKIQSSLETFDSKIDSLEIYEADETFLDRQEFINFITWGKFDLDIDQEKLQQTVEKIFQKYGKEGALVIKHQRFIWTSQINR